MEQSAAQDLQTSLLGVSFDQKWDLLRPVIERLYIHENLKLFDVIMMIKEQYGFDAA